MSRYPNRVSAFFAVTLVQTNFNGIPMPKMHILAQVIAISPKIWYAESN